MNFGCALISYGLQELEDVEERLKAEQEDAQASLDERQYKSSSESPADTEAMKSVMLEKLESKKNDLVRFLFFFFTFHGYGVLYFCISECGVRYFYSLRVQWKRRFRS